MHLLEWDLVTVDGSGGISHQDMLDLRIGVEEISVYNQDYVQTIALKCNNDKRRKRIILKGNSCSVNSKAYEIKKDEQHSITGRSHYHVSLLSRHL